MHAVSKLHVPLSKFGLLPKTIFGFIAIHINIPVAFFIDKEQTILQFLRSHKRPQIANLRKKNKEGGITLPDFKVHCKAVVTKTVWYWHKNTQVYP